MARNHEQSGEGGGRGGGPGPGGGHRDIWLLARLTCYNAQSHYMLVYSSVIKLKLDSLRIERVTSTHCPASDLF